RDDDCTACHMPRTRTSHNPHLATTNHRIPRSLDDIVPVSAPDLDSPELPKPPLVNFHAGLMDDADRLAAERDRGIALCREGRQEGAAEALPLLEAALAARPDDLLAWENLGEAHHLLGQAEEGLAAYQQALQRTPDRQTALEGAADLASKARQPQ